MHKLFPHPLLIASPLLFLLLSRLLSPLLLSLLLAFFLALLLYLVMPLIQKKPILIKLIHTTMSRLYIFAFVCFRVVVLLSLYLYLSVLNSNLRVKTGLIFCLLSVRLSVCLCPSVCLFRLFVFTLELFLRPQPFVTQTSTQNTHTLRHIFPTPSYVCVYVCISALFLPVCLFVCVCVSASHCLPWLCLCC